MKPLAKQIILLDNIVVWDPDAINFILAAQITDAAQKYSINNLITSLKSVDLWSKMTAIYIFVGGNAEAHKYNAKNLSLYNLTFNGGWIHSATGAKANGVNGYADTGINALSILQQNNTHVSYYSRTTGNSSAVEMGYNTSAIVSMTLALNLGNTQYGILHDNGSTGVAPGSGAGMLTSSRINSANDRVFLNAAFSNLRSVTSVAPSNTNVYINARNLVGTGAQLFSPRECAFSSIGTSLTDSEALLLYSIVQQYQISLNRQV